MTISDDDINEQPADDGMQPKVAGDADGTDGADTDGTDGGDTDGTDGGDSDGTDGGDTDGSDGGDADGTAGPAPSSILSAPQLLSGDAQTFLTKVWASRVHVHHADPGALSGLLTFDDVDHLLTGTAIRTPAVRIAQDGTVLPSSAYTRAATIAGQPLTGLVDPRKVFDLFD